MLSTGFERPPRWLPPSSQEPDSRIGIADAPMLNLVPIEQRSRFEARVTVAWSGRRLPVSKHVDAGKGAERDAVGGHDPEDCTVPVRQAAEFAAHFDRSDPSTEQSMIRPRPPRTGDAHWDAFLAALVAWLTVGHGVDVPEWVHDPCRYVEEGWWVTTMPSMHAWEFAGSPASFQSHGVYLHRDSLANV